MHKYISNINNYFPAAEKRSPFSSYVTVNHEGVYTPGGGACWRGSHRPLLGQVTKERAGPWPAGLSGEGRQDGRHMCAMPNTQN